MFWTLFIVRIKYKITTFRKLVLLFGSTVVVASELFALRSPVCYYQRMFRAARWREAIALCCTALTVVIAIWRLNRNVSTELQLTLLARLTLPSRHYVETEL